MGSEGAPLVRGARGELVIADHDAQLDVRVLYGLVKLAEVARRTSTFEIDPSVVEAARAHTKKRS